MNWTQPNSWADRKLVAIKAAGQEKGFPYVFLTSCVEAKAEDLEEMGRRSVEVTYIEMKRRCDLIPFEREMMYDIKNEGGLTLEEDRQVFFARSHYKGCPCFYLIHSAIEYIWVAHIHMWCLGVEAKDRQEEKNDQVLEDNH